MGDFTPYFLVSPRERAFGAPDTVWINFPHSSFIATATIHVKAKPFATESMDQDSRWKQLGVVQAELLWFETKKLLSENHLSDFFCKRSAVLPVPWHSEFSPMYSESPSSIMDFQTKKCWDSLMNVLMCWSLWALHSWPLLWSQVAKKPFTLK